MNIVVVQTLTFQRQIKKLNYWIKIFFAKNNYLFLDFEVQQ